MHCDYCINLLKKICRKVTMKRLTKTVKMKLTYHIYIKLQKIKKERKHEFCARSENRIKIL